VIGDAGAMAIATARARLLRAGVPLAIETSAELPAADVPVGVAVERVSATAVRVQLLAPREPLAWCVGAARRGGLRVAWHSERRPGARPVPAAAEAVLDAAEGAPLAVRVYGDDGTVSTTTATAPGARVAKSAGA
jgi:hypothetical protein